MSIKVRDAGIPPGPTSAFTIIQPDNGTSPTASGTADTLTLTSSDGSITITGIAATDTIDFAVGPLGVDLTTDVTGVLPVANGGTSSSAALNNDRIMASRSGAIVESTVTVSTDNDVAAVRNLDVTGNITVQNRDLLRYMLLFKGCG